MRIASALAAALIVMGPAAASVSDAESAFQKLALIESGARPGARISFTGAEINAWIRDAAKTHVPQGLSNVKLGLAPGHVTGSVDIDFLKIQRAATGSDPGWLMRSLFAGEHPVIVATRFQSIAGRARFDVERVEIGGVPIEGHALDFVIDQFVRPTFPDVKVNEWFPLRYGVDRISVAPNGVAVFMARKTP